MIGGFAAHVRPLMERDIWRILRVDLPTRPRRSPWTSRSANCSTRRLLRLARPADPPGRPDLPAVRLGRPPGPPPDPRPGAGLPLPAVRAGLQRLHPHGLAQDPLSPLGGRPGPPRVRPRRVDRGAGRELGRNRPHLLGLRHRLQDNALARRDAPPLPDAHVEADEMYQNAGEKRGRAPRPGRPAAAAGEATGRAGDVVLG